MWLWKLKLNTQPTASTLGCDTAYSKKTTGTHPTRQGTDKPSRWRNEQRARPWQGTISDWDIGAGAVVNVATNVTCWAFWLQWDVTSVALANFVNVPGQGDFNSADPSATKLGNPLSTCGATTSVAAFNETASAPSNGNMPGRNEVKVGWQGISGDWHRQGSPVASVVVYGLRVVFTGMLHSWNNAGQDWLVRDDALNAKGACSLDHNAGGLNAMLMRVK